MSREDFLRTVEPHLFAKLRLYKSDEGGRKGPAYFGCGWPCTVAPEEMAGMLDGYPLMEADKLMPGFVGEIGFWFFSGQKAASIMIDAGKFYLWENRIVGEAEVIDPAPRSS